MRAWCLALAAVVTASVLPGCRRPHVNAPAAPAAPASMAQSSPGPPPAPPPARLLARGTADVAVIMYHDVVPRKEVWFDLTVREFERQMRSLAEAGANVVPLSDVVEHLRDGKELPPRAIALTFDDGTLGNYEHAFPILQQYGFQATFFVHTDYVGVKSSKPHMTWDQLRELKLSGLIDVQPHTASHPEDLRKMSDEAVRKELSKSNAVLEREMLYPARFLAYPSGHADDRIARLVEEAGYEAAWNEERAWNASPADRFHLPRFAPFRLDEVLEAWRANRPAPPAVVTMKADFRGQAPRTEGVLTYRLGPWTPESLDAGEPLLSDDGFRPMPDGRQHGSIGRPVAILGADGMLLAPYQPWIGAERAAMEVLMPGIRRAAMGREWLVSGGEVRDGTVRARGSVLGMLEDGTPFSAEVAAGATAESLADALRKIGARDAVLL